VLEVQCESLSNKSFTECKEKKSIINQLSFFSAFPSATFNIKDQIFLKPPKANLLI